MTRTVAVNGRTYRSPRRPSVVVCVDGCEPAYVDDAIATGAAPALRRFRERGTYRLSRTIVPSTMSLTLSPETNSPAPVESWTIPSDFLSANPLRAPLSVTRDETLMPA